LCFLPQAALSVKVDGKEKKEEKGNYDDNDDRVN
jgi:hypothetical protein